MPPLPSPDDRERRLDALLAEYFSELDSGAVPDREQFLRAHPQEADELRELLKAEDMVQRMAGPRLDEMPVDPDASTQAMAVGGQAGRDEDNEETVKLPGRGGPASDASQGDASQGVDSPLQFGDYELLEILGRGGMGVVYKARQLGLQRLVAVKMILNARLASDDEVRRFYIEARAAANIRHHNVVQIHDIGEEDGQPFFSMELVEGGDLSQLIRQPQPVDPRRAARLVRDAARAVQAAHDQGVLHRDIKPGNILVGPQDRVVVTDFGLAKTLEPTDESLTSAGLTMGTPAYMSPEQAAGYRERMGPASDVYSLGAVLFALLTGGPPHQGETAMNTMLDVIQKPTPHPLSLNPGADPALSRIALKCLDKEPHRRYESARALAEDLDRYLRGEPVRAQRLGRVGRCLAWCRQMPIMAALLGRPVARPSAAQVRAQAAMILLVMLLAVALVTVPIIRRAVHRRMPSHVVIAGGEPGGMYDRVARQLAAAMPQAPGCDSSEVLPTTGSGDNFGKLVRGEAHLALLQEALIDGREIEVVAPLYYETVYIVVRDDGPVRSLEALASRRVAAGPPNSGMARTTEVVLDGVEAELVEVSFGELAKDPSLAAAVVTIGPDNDSLRSLLASGQYRLLGLDSRRAQRLADVDPRFNEATISHEDFPRAGVPALGLTTVKTPAFLACRRNASAQLVDGALNRLYELGLENLLSQQNAAHWTFLPWHPAAKKFFSRHAESSRPER